MKRLLLAIPVLLALSGLFILRATYTYWYSGSVPGTFTSAFLGGPRYNSSYGGQDVEFAVNNGTSSRIDAYFNLPANQWTYWGDQSIYYDYLWICATDSGQLLVHVITQTDTIALASTSISFGDNSTLRMIEKGNLLIVYFNNELKLTVDLTGYTLNSGPPGYDPWPDAPSTIAIGPADTTAPVVIPSTSITRVPYTNKIDLQWPATTDAGIGLFRYEIWRNGSLLTTTTNLTYSDTAGITPNTTYNYELKAIDYHLNASTTTFSVTSLPLTTPTGSPSITSNPDGRRVGVHATGAYWGAGTENIDVMSGNLNVSLPILSAKARSGWSVPFALSYNSQLWKWASSANWKYPTATGYGYGWRLMAGAIRPVYSDPYTISHYVFTDSTGAEYLLNYTFNGAWASTDSIYLYYVASSNRLYFGNGSFWEFGSTAASGEVDSGVMYPTLMQDSNGNQIKVKYLTGSGASWVNSSSRIDEIDDILNTSGSGYAYTYKFTYTSSLLTKVERPMATTGSSGPSMKLDFTYDTTPQTLVSPFDSTTHGTITRLLSVFDDASDRSHSFTYNTAAELTQVTLPYGGRLAYYYITWTYPSGNKYREVSNRYLYKDYTGGTGKQYSFAHESTTTGSVHTYTQLTDPSNVGQKYWEFGQSGAQWGKVTKYEGRDLNSSPTAKVRNDYTWSYDSATINAYISQVLTTKDPTKAYEVQSKTTQALDNFGNVTTASVYDYNSLSTPKRTDTYTYGSAANFNFRMLLTGPDGLAIAYDQHDTLSWNLTNTSSYRLWDSTRKTQSDRGLPTTVTKLGQTVNYSYMVAGQPYTVTSNGVTRMVSVNVAQNFNVPTQLSVSGTTNFDQSIEYNSLQEPKKTTDANSVETNTTYDQWGRIATVTSPFGAVTTMTFGASSPAVNEASVNGRWSKTTLDGLGRTIKAETGHGGTTVSIAETEYDSCGCSPLGKVKKSSLPYASGGTPVWTTYTYDGIGRTLSTSTTGSDTSTQTTYLYEGNTVKVTDAAGAWKKYTTNILGQIAQVNEPNPAGGSDYVTTYTYNALGNLTGVSMPRPTGTQTRTFNYNSNGQITSSVQPETGTTTYTYFSDGRLESKTDAKNQLAYYEYDAYKRLSRIRYYVGGNVDYCLRQGYGYDDSPNGKGKLAAVLYGWDTAYGSSSYCPYSVRETYEYSTAGATSKKTLRLKQKNGITSTSMATVELDSTYTYDNEGRMTAIQYPKYWNGSSMVNGPNRGLEYDDMGRPKKLKDLTASTDIISATTYNAMGQLLTMTGAGGAPSETRTYNSIGQMTRMTQGSLDIQYNYPSSNNNGKIESETDVVSGETVTYTYDSLNRLATATSSDTPGWGQSFGYDGFGNLNNVGVTKGSAPTLSVTYDASTNRRSTDCSDANGNISPCGTPYTFDILNRISAAGGKTYYYASGNQRVWKGSGTGSSATGEFVFYSIGGAKLATYTTTISTSNIRPSSPVYFDYFAGKMLKNSTGWVNSDIRSSIGKFFPYGQERPSATSNNKEKFATYYRDTETGLDYAQNRYHSAGDGRFLTPDPAGQGLNWYAYAGGDPINHIDPSGLTYYCISAGGFAQQCVWEPDDLYDICSHASAALDFYFYFCDGVIVGQGGGGGGSTGGGGGSTGPLAGGNGPTTTPIASSTDTPAVNACSWTIAGCNSTFVNTYVGTLASCASDCLNSNAQAILGMVNDNLNTGWGMFINAGTVFVTMFNPAATAAAPETTSVFLTSQQISSFSHGVSSLQIAQQDMQVSRVWSTTVGNETGQYVTVTPISSGAQAQSYLALPNTPNMIQPWVTIPQGTAYNIGTVAPNFGFTGGGTQLLIPKLSTVFYGPSVGLLPH